MSDQAPVFHQGGWWAQRGGEWLVYFRGVWMTPSEAASEAVTNVGGLGLAAGIFGFIVTFFSPAIVFGVAIMAALTAIGLAVAAVNVREGHRKALAIWALVLAVATAASALAIFGVVVGSAYAVVVFVLPLLIGGTAAGLGIAELTSPRRGGKGLASRASSWEPSPSSCVCGASRTSLAP